MGSTSSVVEINGSQYDAYSGQLIKAGKKTKEQVKYHTSRVIDGFVKNSATKKPTPVKSEVKKSPAVTKKSPISTKSRPVNSATSLHQRTERSRTLMREAVAKPVAIAKKSISNSFSNVAHTSSLKPSTQERASRAQKVIKHAKVRRFGSPQVEAPTPIDKPDSISSSVKSKQPPTAALSVSTNGTALMSSIPAALSHQRLEQMLDRALAQADTHKQALNKHRQGSLWSRVKSSPRWLSLIVLGFVVLLLIAFFVWQSIPQIALKVASMRTHVSASLPSYTPSGFSYAGHIDTKAGKVTIPYHAEGNSSKMYTVTESPSTQDTSSMVANSTTANQQVQTSQANGVPVVIVDNKDSKSGTATNKAMCVNNGVQTVVTNSANLAPDELLNIAKSVCAN